MSDENIIGVARVLTWDKKGGILLETIRAGEGEEGPRIGDRVFVHYVGKLQDGTVFETSRDREEPFQFTIGRAEVVRGWDCAIANMRKGELARITCAPEYAYEAVGTARHPRVPHNATVVFEVELIDWKGVDLSPDQDGGIIKRMEKQGQRVATPIDGAIITIRFTGRCEGEAFERREVTFTQGEGDEEGLIPGMEIATKHMKKGEHDRLTIAAKYAYGEKGCSELGIPPSATLVYNVEMVDFKMPPDPCDMDLDGKIWQSKEIKEKGTYYFKKENYARAMSHYSKVVSYLEPETSGVHGNQQEEVEQLLLAAHLNLALCNLKCHMFPKVEEECECALKIDSSNVKAYYRRGQARLSRCNYGGAVEDFAKAAELDPSNWEARQGLRDSRQKQKEAYYKEKQLYASMLPSMLNTSLGAEGAAPTPDIDPGSSPKPADLDTLPEQ